MSIQVIVKNNKLRVRVVSNTKPSSSRLENHTIIRVISVINEISTSCIKIGISWILSNRLINMIKRISEFKEMAIVKDKAKYHTGKPKKATKKILKNEFSKVNITPVRNGVLVSCIAKKALVITS